MAGSSSSESRDTLRDTRRAAAVDEAHFEQIDVAMMYVEEARARAERAAEALRRDGAEPHLVEALEQAQAELSEVGRRLRQGTLFAVPKEQLSL
jgi:septation ring formation regulator EzrA